ncbi:hypothetical protein H072_11433 [Dactylellina haptotyla CBS 200.50]|uniref:Uncharacterized protein n=1 Tax=Dactylellina haptotyla (strain CBS 200.50) TaxID=1284197 RepID=S8A280_DACHA|nr:hypothetical protein H072_11433 [Dactylellina haptotyla CBS 200.50]
MSMSRLSRRRVVDSGSSDEAPAAEEPKSLGDGERGTEFQSALENICREIGKRPRSAKYTVEQQTALFKN